MSTYDLAALIELEKTATGGEWIFRDDCLSHWWVHEKYAPNGTWACVQITDYKGNTSFISDEDGELLVALRNASPTLLADFQLCLKTLDELARLGGIDGEYSNSTGSVIAQACLKRVGA